MADIAPTAARRQLYALPIALLAVALSGARPAAAGGILHYEFGTAKVGLAAAGYAARAQDASTAFTNPAGMTRLEGTQALAGGQIMWLSNRFSVGSGTSPALGSDNGGRAIGSDGLVRGAGAFVTHRLSPDLWLGFSVAGNFGSIIAYDDNWVGRYRVQQATLLGGQFVPSIAYRVNDKLSIGAGLNAVYGIFDHKVAINNVLPALADGGLDRWTVLGNVGWQQWSKLGQVEIGIDNTLDPTGLTSSCHSRTPGTPPSGRSTGCPIRGRSTSASPTTRASRTVA